MALESGSKACMCRGNITAGQLWAVIVVANCCGSFLGDILSLRIWLI